MYGGRGSGYDWPPDGNKENETEPDLPGICPTVIAGLCKTQTCPCLDCQCIHANNDEHLTPELMRLEGVMKKQEIEAMKWRVAKSIEKRWKLLSVCKHNARELNMMEVDGEPEGKEVGNTAHFWHLLVPPF